MRKLPFILLLIFLTAGNGIDMPDQNSDTIVGLNNEEKVYLLTIARSTISHYLQTGKLIDSTPDSDKLKEKFGVFVTLHKNGKLRGCIGYIEGIDALHNAVVAMAHSAAFRDPRFPPVETTEIDNLEIEISVLSPLKKIENIDEIMVGQHGLVIKQGLSRGLLLPQVAPEWGWDRKEFLEQTCQKAGLPSNAWEDQQTEIYIFSAEIFSEKDF
jgi:AmmeMemoRadiSam system protein A